jgi:hypothetical protein
LATLKSKGYLMRNILIASAFALVGLSAAAPSQAMPFAPADKAPSAITLTAGGCGAGFHRGPNGGCRPNGGVYAHPYAHRHCWWRRGVRVCN